MSRRWQIGVIRWVVVLTIAGMCGLALSSQVSPAAALQPDALLPASPGLRVDPVSIVMSYVEREGGADDPLIEVEQDVWAKASNVNGVLVGGQVFYYRLAPDASFDPLSLGRADPADVTIWRIVDDGPIAVVIYQINPMARHSAL